ncbi:hypothetical protein [Kitasatospora purpeofusca]|uniref:hypothetical protein n=1 Tax=Kitasatospora purpeofusca TaxID=67352 RepID=UPI003862E425|nr:hypothetical protein OIP63_00145 [Kitasatospora purpeofusca]
MTGHAVPDYQARGPRRIIAGLLRPGDLVRWDDGEYAVMALLGPHVRLRRTDGEDSVEVIASVQELVASAGFTFLSGAPLPAVPPPVTLMEAIPEEAEQQAREWERHIIEVETGIRPGSRPGTEPRPGYDPAITTLVDRYRLKAAELSAVGSEVSWQTVQRKRLAWVEQGVWGLVDKRAARARQPCGQVHPRVVAELHHLIGQDDGESTGSVSRWFGRLNRRIRQINSEIPDEQDHVPMPSPATFYRLVERLGLRSRLTGSARSRREIANRPDTPFGHTSATRPGELVMIDSSGMDISVAGTHGHPVPVEITAAIDVTTRTVAGAILRERLTKKTVTAQAQKAGRKKRRKVSFTRQGRGTKAVDAALMLGCMLIPQPAASHWPEQARLAGTRNGLHGDELTAADGRMKGAAARPVIVPETVIVDHGKVYVSEAFLDACTYLGISVMPAREMTATDKAIVERTFSSIKSLFCQHVAGYTGKNILERGKNATRRKLWTLPELNDLLQQWLAHQFTDHGSSCSGSDLR